MEMVRSHNFSSTKVIASELHNDRPLFIQISAGDEKAFRTIFDLYRLELFSVVIRLTKSQVIAEEIIQEVFISLWISRQHLIKVEEPASYIYRILFNRTGNYLKKKVTSNALLEQLCSTGNHLLMPQNSSGPVPKHFLQNFCDSCHRIFTNFLLL